MSNTIPSSIEQHIRADAYAKFIGATIEEIGAGTSRVSLTVTDEMLNFHHSAHGGIIFGLGDLAFAAACNSHGRVAVALNVNIAFVRAAQAGDYLVAEAREVSLSNSTGLYEIIVFEKESGEMVAKMQATAYRKRESFGATKK